MKRSCNQWECTRNRSECCKDGVVDGTDKAKLTALTSAGQVGSSVLLVAREGDQQLDTTASQLGPLVARDELIDKSGGGYVCSACHYPFTNEEDLKNHYCDD